MTLDQVIFSYKLSLVEVGFVILLVYFGWLSAGFGMIVASAIAGNAYGREMAWRHKSG